MSYSACPSCGLEKELVLCNKCNYSEEKPQPYRELLNIATNTLSGYNAFLDNGCLTCKPCKEQWVESGFYCPTRLFYGDSLLLSIFYNYEKFKEKGFPQSMKDVLLEIQSFQFTQSKEDMLVFRKRLYENTMGRLVKKIEEDESLIELKKLIYHNGRIGRLLS